MVAQMLHLVGVVPYDRCVPYHMRSWLVFCKRVFPCMWCMLQGCRFKSVECMLHSWNGMFAAHRRCSDSSNFIEQGYLHLLLTCCAALCCAMTCRAVLCCAVLCCAVPKTELLMPVGMNMLLSKSWSRQLASQVSLCPGQQALLAVAASCPAVAVLLSAVAAPCPTVAAPCPTVAAWWAAAGLKRWPPHNLSWA